MRADPHAGLYEQKVALMQTVATGPHAGVEFVPMMPIGEVAASLAA